MRNLPQTAKNALAADNVMLVALVDIALSLPIHSSSAHEITHNGTTYRSDSGLLDVPDITQDFSLSASTITLNYSDNDKALLTAALNDGYLDAQVDISIAIIDPGTYALLHVIPSVYRGYVDDLQTNPKNTQVAFVVKNHAHRFDRKAGRKTNNASQHRFFPDDAGFNQITQSSGDWL